MCIISVHFLPSCPNMTPQSNEYNSYKLSIVLRKGLYSYIYQDEFDSSANCFQNLQTSIILDKGLARLYYSYSRYSYFYPI